MFTYATVTHQYENPDGSAPTGSVSFTLVHGMTNGSVTLPMGAAVVVPLSSAGIASAAVASTLDPDTQVDGPAGSSAYYRITERIGDLTNDFFAAMPSGVVDIGELYPSSVDPLPG